MGNHWSGTPYSFTVHRVEGIHGRFSGENNQYTWSAEGTFAQTASDASFYQSSLDANATQCYNEAVSKVWEDVRGSVDLSIDAGQIRQTLQMMHHPMNGLLSLARLARKRARKQGAKNLANIWLEMRYGWMPLLGEIHELAKRPGLSDNGRRYFKGKNKRKMSNTRESNATYFGYNQSTKITVDSEHTCSVFVVLNLSNASKVQKLARYTSLNPVSIAWELLPYSFVIDWLYDISGYLRSMESAMLYGSLVEASWRSDLAVVKTTVRATGYTAPLNKGSTNLKGTEQSISFNRSSVVGSPKPTSPITSLPTELSWKRWTSAVALLSQLLTGSPVRKR